MPNEEVPSVESLYQTILSRKPLPLPGFEAIVEEQAINRANRIHEYLVDRADRVNADCECCFERSARISETRWVYETPWDKHETEKAFCSEECADIYLSEGDFSYFWCDPCGREICERHPMNGWQVQYRMVDDEQICLRCYQDRLLEEGLEFEKEKLERGEIPGMFFSYGNLEPKDAGYEEVLGFRNYLINDSEKAERFKKKALQLMEEGHKVIISYERLAIGGGEGYVTLMVKD